MAGLSVPTYWDETRSAIVLVQRKRSFEFDKEYVIGQMRKQGVKGSVEAVYMPLKMPLKKGLVDETQLETGIVVFREPRTCQEFINAFPDNAKQLHRDSLSFCDTGSQTEHEAWRHEASEDRPKDELAARSLALVTPPGMSQERVREKLAQLLATRPGAPHIESVLYPVQPQDLGISTLTHACALVTVSSQEDIDQMKQILTDDMRTFMPVPEQSVTTSLITIPRTTLQKLAASMCITEDGVISGMKQECCVAIEPSHHGQGVVARGHWIRIKALCEKITTQLQKSSQASPGPTSRAEDDAEKTQASTETAAPTKRVRTLALDEDSTDSGTESRNAEHRSEDGSTGMGSTEISRAKSTEEEEELNQLSNWGQNGLQAQEQILHSATDSDSPRSSRASSMTEPQTRSSRASSMTEPQTRSSRASSMTESTSKDSGTTTHAQRSDRNGPGIATRQPSEVNGMPGFSAHTIPMENSRTQDSEDMEPMDTTESTAELSEGSQPMAAGMSSVSQSSVAQHFPQPGQAAIGSTHREDSADASSVSRGMMEAQGGGSEAPRSHEPQRHESQSHEPQSHEPQSHGPQSHEPQSHEPQSHAPQLSAGKAEEMSYTGQSTNYTEEFPAVALFMKYFDIVDGGIATLWSLFKVRMSLTDCGQKKVQVRLCGNEGENVMKAKHYVTNEISKMNKNVTVKNVYVGQHSPTLVQTSMAKLQKQFPNTITHYDKEDQIVELCGQRIDEYARCLQALLYPASSEDIVTYIYTTATPMWKYISEKVPRHISDIVKKHNVNLNPIRSGNETTVEIKGPKTDIDQVLENLHTRVAALKSQFTHDTVYSGRERQRAEELQPLFDRVMLSEESGNRIGIAGLRKDVDEAKGKLQSMLLSDRQIGGSPHHTPEDRPVPDLHGVSVLPGSVAKGPTGGSAASPLHAAPSHSHGPPRASSEPTPQYSPGMGATGTPGAFSPPAGPNFGGHPGPSPQQSTGFGVTGSSGAISSSAGPVFGGHSEASLQQSTGFGVTTELVFGGGRTPQHDTGMGTTGTYGGLSASVGSVSDTVSRPSPQHGTGMGTTGTSGSFSSSTRASSEPPPPSTPKLQPPPRHEPDFSQMRTPPITLQSRTGSLQLHILQYDITKMKVDVVVTSASETLQHRYGASRAILAAAGESVKKECQKIMEKRYYDHLSMGKAYVTRQGDLPCSMLLHAIVPSKKRTQRETSRSEDVKLMANALTECFKEASRRGHKTIAFPPLNAGFVGRDVSIEAIITAIKKTMDTARSTIKHMYLVDIDQDMVAHLQSKISAMRDFSKTAFQGTAPAQLQFGPPGRVDVRTRAADPQGLPPTSTAPGSRASTLTTPAAGASAAGAGEDCAICFDTITRPKTLACSHTFCSDCIDQAFAKTKPACPVCGKIYGTLKGDQPLNGSMDTRKDWERSLPGYDGCAVIVIDYHFPVGFQTSEHPNPGQRYKGLRRTAYLPDNDQGRKVERLLRKAFDARLTFTIGRSVTTGRENQVTWNDIHHKTSMTGGASKFGYPDPGYLQRVQDELAAKGITE